MQRITVFITDETRQRIDRAAKAKNKIGSELIREALDTGLNVIYPKSQSAQALLQLAKLAKGLPSEPGEPSDVSLDTAKYAFGEDNE